ncbi:intraflagellar transport 46 [Lycorma delicatula]|uniref:intraflagellar transport 46 n=1 Tax=Lycorma delicatula TaxID=130591 RepID=UPI003F51288D
MYDETIDVQNAEEVRSPTPESAESGYDKLTKQTGDELSQIVNKGSSTLNRPMSAVSRSDHSVINPHRITELESDLSDHSDDDDDEDDDDDDDVQAPILEGSYDPRDYDHLTVSADVKDVFKYITCYTPQSIELEYKLKPFIPDFIPAVGDIDAFLKVNRPDGMQDDLGLRVLDEPCANQSEPAVLYLQLRANTKQTSAKPVVVKKVENAEKNPKAIDRWIKDINELHKSRPAQNIQYTRTMPDIDGLMQEWPQEFEECLNKIGLPIGDLECDLLTLVDIVCCLLDIPKYESRIESLHVLFYLYSAIKNTQISIRES